MTILDAALGAILTLLLAGLWAAAKWNRLRNEDLAAARKHRDKFFKAAEQVVSDSRAPEALVRVIMILARGMTRALPLYLMFLEVPRPTRPPDMVVKISDLPEDLRRPTADALVSAICTMTYQSAALGPLVRRRLCIEEGNDKKRKNGPGVAKVERIAGKVVNYELRHASA